MNAFRSHITRTLSVAALLAGMALYFLKPATHEANQSDFAVWLQSHLKTNADTGDVVNQIHKLSLDREGKIETVIRQASSLVKTHAEDFELPVQPETQNENDVFQVLLTEWNAYQNSTSGMGKAVIIKQAQPYTVLPVDGIAFSAQAFNNEPELFAHSLHSVPLFLTPVSINYHISPLSGGTAIGAP